MSEAHVLEGVIRVDDADDLGFYEIYIGERSVAKWVTEVVPWGEGERNVKAILMVEDEVCLEAQGRLTSDEGEYGYSSWTPGSGPIVWVWDNSKFHDIAEKLTQHEGRNAALSLEAID